MKKKSVSASRSSLSWIVPRRLIVGRQPGVEQVSIFQASGISAILTLCPACEVELPPQYTEFFECVRIPLKDSHAPELLTPAELATAVAQVDRLISAKHTVYVHCRAGIERAPLVCLSYLCRHHHLEVWEALRFLKEVHASTAPTPEQIQVAHEYLRLSVPMKAT